MSSCGDLSFGSGGEGDFTPALRLCGQHNEAAGVPAKGALIGCGG
jgi:hypothetical protein